MSLFLLLLSPFIEFLSCLSRGSYIPAEGNLHKMKTKKKTQKTAFGGKEAETNFKNKEEQNIKSWNSINSLSTELHLHALPKVRNGARWASLGSKFQSKGAIREKALCLVAPSWPETGRLFLADLQGHVEEDAPAGIHTLAL